MNKREKLLKKLEENARADIECLNALCKESNNQIKRQLSFVEDDIMNLLRFIWESS